MKKMIFLLAALFLSLNLSAQEWQTDLETAKQISTAQNRPIILVFQGSDWCAPCIKLNREIWSTEEFREYAKDHFVLLLADFPKKKKNALSREQQEKNNQLANIYNENGYFPLVVILDKEGKVLGKTGYEKTTPSEYIAKLEFFLK